MSKKKLLPAELDPRNPSYAYKNKYNEHVENTDQFNNYVKSVSYTHLTLPTTTPV